MEYKKTIFCDIDGTLVKHHDSIVTADPNHEMDVLPGVYEKLREWALKEYTVILVTGRRESLRKVTENQLRKAKISYDLLLMGVGRGSRVVINDQKPDGFISAESICIKRDEGLTNIKV